jgi:excinuclease ABC subunit C
LRLLQRIRNEAHDTAINYHRKKRDEKTLRSQLYAIKGVGKETAKKLLSTFKSMDGIRKADLPQLAKVVGMARAMQIHEFFHAPSTDT